jgi:hypothetical protein
MNNNMAIKDHIKEKRILEVVDTTKIEVEDEEELVLIKEHKDRDKIGSNKEKTLIIDKEKTLLMKIHNKRAKWVVYFFPNYNSFKKRSKNDNILTLVYILIYLSLF